MSLWRGGQVPTAASQVEKSQPSDETKQGSPQIGETRKQTIDDPQPQQDTSSDAASKGQADQSPDTESPANDNGESAPETTITLSQSKVSLTAGETSAPITATIPAESAGLTWEVTNDPKVGLVITQEETTGGLRLTIKADQVDKKHTYDVIVIVKDAAQNTVDSKIITVTIL